MVDNIPDDKRQPQTESSVGRAETRVLSRFPDYAVDESGNVYSKKSGEWVKLKPITHPRGYQHIHIHHGKAITCRIHRLVMEAFRGFSNLEVNHIDGNKGNNNLSNLEYCTPKENVRHAFTTGLSKGKKGTKNGRAKLNNESVKDLLALKGQISQTAASKIFGISQVQVGNIWNGKGWI
jgi:hypothetical protein